MSPNSTSSGHSTSKEDLIRELLELKERMRHFEAGSGGNAGKVPRPQSYNGEGSIRSFLTQSKAYLRDNLGTIVGENNKVMCVGGLLTGKAAEWWEPTLRDYLNHEDAGQDPDTRRVFSDYDAFEQLLTNTFGNPDEVRTAERQLLSLRQTGSASYYSREFTNINAKLDWDDAALIVQFYKGLREDVKDELSKMTRPNSLQVFMNQAIKIDNRLYERRMEKKKNGGYPMFGRGNPGANTSRIRNTSTAWGHHSGRMELDATRNEPKKKGSGVCYNCGKKGHFANKCRQRKSWKPVPERNASVAQKDEIPHASLHFSACYQDNCLIHKSAKDGAGWYPQERRVCMTIAEDWDYDTQPPDYYESFPDPNLQETVEETSEEESCSEDEESHAHGHGIDVTDPSVLEEVLTMGAIHSLNPFYQAGDARGVHPRSAEHGTLSWFCCVHHFCKEHMWEKLDNRWFPSRVDDERIDEVYKWDELYGWTIAHKYPNGWALLVKPGYDYSPPTVVPTSAQPQPVTPSSSQEQRKDEDGDRPKSHSKRSKETEDHHRQLRDAARRHNKETPSYLTRLKQTKEKAEKGKSSKNGRRWW